jgi:hypothetical protein
LKILVDCAQRQRIPAANLEIVRNLERDAIDDVYFFSLDVVRNRAGQ